MQRSPKAGRSMAAAAAITLGLTLAPSAGVVGGSRVAHAATASPSPFDAARTVFPKLQAPGGNAATRLNISGSLVEWMATPTVVSVFLPPDSGRTISAPSGVQLRDTAVVGTNVFAVDTSDRLLMAALDHGGFVPVANVAGAGGIYTTAKEVWVRTVVNGTKTMHRFNGATGKKLGTLPKVHSVMAWSSTRTAAIADGADPQKQLDLIVYDVATTKELRRDVWTKAMSSAAWIGNDELLLAFPDEVVAVDYVKKTKTPLKDVMTEDVIGKPDSGTVAALANGRFGVWLPKARKMIDVGTAPTGAADLRDGVFWAWDKAGLVRIDLVKLRSGLAAAGDA